MSLKKRLILILLFSGIIFALLVHFIVNATIIPDLKQQKKIFIEKIKIELQTALNIEKKNITTLCNIWASCNGMKNYIKNPSIEFEKEFFSDSSFSSHMLNLILVLGPGEKILYNKNYRDNLKFINLESLKIEKSIDKIKKIVKKTRRSFESIINSEYGPLMIIGNPVNTGEKGQPLSEPGILMLGRFMDKKLQKRISFHFSETLQLISFREKQLFSYYLKEMQLKKFHYQEDEKKITILYLVNDIDDTPLFIMRLVTGNKIFRMIKKNTILYVTFTVLSLFFLGFLIYFSIGKYINKRIIKISSEMKKVQGLKDISIRITKDKLKDEISSLILEINNMLDKIEIEKENMKKIEQTLITNEKLVSVGRLTSSIAHEINNPILAISNCLQVLKKSREGISELEKEAMVVSEKEITRVRNIITNLLDLQRMDIGEFTEVKLNHVILKALEVLKWSKKLDSLKIITENQQNFITFGSKGKLEQVFINFILNSIEANTTDKGVLRIKILPSGDKRFCEVHLIDNGPGISPKIKDKLFEPFVSTKEDKGVGLGLYVSYKIIKNHNGEILYNDTYKNGAYFIIKLPIKERQE